MRYLIFIYLFLFSTPLLAQILKGTVTDGETGRPLSPVNVLNTVTGQSVFTEKDGTYTIDAKTGNIIKFTFIGYEPATGITPAGIGVATLKTQMKQQFVQLQEYTVHTYTPYQKDSMEMREVYGKELDKQPIKPKVGLNNGLAVDGLISAAAQNFSKSFKEEKKFRKDFQKSMEDRFIDTRYTPELTAALTGFTGEKLALFMNTYPMAYDFARAASDLEIKMWIRYNYKQYINTANDTLQKTLVQLQH